MSKWLYNGVPLTEAPEGMFGFCYKISCLDHPKYGGYFYIGAKQFRSNRTKKLSKKASEATYSGRGRKPTKIKIQSESNWKNYNSSSKELVALIKEIGEENFKFEILQLAPSKSWLAFYETKMIFDTEALFQESFNYWVSCKVMRINLK